MRGRSFAARLSSVLAVGVLLFLTSCASRSFPAEQVDQRYYITLPGRSKNQIFVRSTEWIFGSSNPIFARRIFADRDIGKLMVDFRIEMEVNPGHTSRIATTIDLTIEDERVYISFLRLRIQRDSVFSRREFFRPASRHELRVWQRFSEELANELKRYIMSLPVQPQLERRRRAAL